MRRMLSPTLAAVLLLQPVLAFAVFESPADLFVAMMRDPAPRTFSGEVHASFDAGVDGTMYVSFWMNGAQEGNNVVNGKARMQGTLDVAFPSAHITVRTKASVLYVDHTVYVRLDAFDGMYDDPMMLGEFNFFLKKWIRIPIDRKMIVELKKQTMDFSALNDLFTLARTQTRGGNSYTLTLKPEILQAFLAGMTGDDVVPAPGEPVTLKIDMSAQDRFQASLLSVAIANDRATLKGAAKSTRSTAPLFIAVPKDSVSLEELSQFYEDSTSPVGSLSELGGSLIDVPSLWDLQMVPPSAPSETWEEEEGDADDDSWQWEEEEASPAGCTVIEIQRRQCAGARPSRREQ